MAIVLDINFLCDKMLDMDIVEELLHAYQITIESISSIENWMWENEREVQCLKQVGQVLHNDQIAMIKLKQSLFKDMGVYIEKNEFFYHYTLWMNTEGYPMLDCDQVTEGNYRFYEAIFQMILKANARVNNAFAVVGIGLETDIHYSRNIIDIIQRSTNIMFWIINRNIELIDRVDGYREKM